MTVNIDFSRRINGEFRIHAFLGSGHYSKVYSVQDQNGRTRAAKFVAIRHKKLIEAESRAMQKSVERRAYGMHYWYYFGKHGDCYVLVMDLLGRSIFDLHRQYRGLRTKSILMIGIQLTKSLKKLHDRGFIHRDLQPYNFVIGRSGTELGYVYLIDYGLSFKYRDSEDRHRSRAKSRDNYGTSPFSPCHAARLQRQSRRSDLESLLYNIVFLMKGTLPWMEKSDSDTLRAKERITAGELCSGLPRELKQYFRDVRALGYSERPNYSKLVDYLKTALVNAGHKMDNKFEWN